LATRPENDTNDANTVSETNAYAAFARFEREFWDKTGPVYSEGFGPITSQTVPCLLRHLRLSPPAAPATLLDVACGPGFISAALAGSDVTVVGADLSTEMLRVARTLNPGARFEQADAEALPFPDESFDAVSCNFGLLHFSEPPRAIGEAARVLRRGGRYAYAVWDTPERNRALSIIMTAVKPYVAGTAMPEGPPFFHYADRIVGQQALERVGLIDIAIEEVPMIWPIGSAASVLRYFRDGGARIGEVLRQLTPDAARQVEASVAAALADYASPESPGAHTVPTAAVVFSGRKPA
jgi:SAM-dependent methyltransferase